MNVVIIPARLASTRLPRKALVDIHGKPAIQRVYEGCVGANGIDEIYVATPDKEIAEVVSGFGGQAVMTGPHNTVLGRCAEAARKLEPDAVVVVGGDEPMVNPNMVELALSGLNKYTYEGREKVNGVSVLVTEIESPEELNNPGIIKYVVDNNDYVMYMTRAAVPARYKQSDIMAMGWRSLEAFDASPQPDLEIDEGLDTIRFLYYGQAMRAVVSPYITQGLDTEADLKKIRELWDEDSRTSI